jgi:mannosyltransferase OCH1-like enzyme
MPAVTRLPKSALVAMPHPLLQGSSRGIVSPFAAPKSHPIADRISLPLRESPTTKSNRLPRYTDLSQSEEVMPNLWQHGILAKFDKYRPLPEQVKIPQKVRIPKIREYEQKKYMNKTIYQVFTRGEDKLPQEIIDSRARMQLRNPDWQIHKVIDEDYMRKSLLHDYGADVLAYFDAIDENYMAAKIDVFKYLHSYKHGGVYLDIKSEIEKPIKDIFSEKDGYLLAHWHNKKDEEHQGYGLGTELKNVTTDKKGNFRGEFQQWHLISMPGHPYLLQASKEVLANLEAYRPWRHGVGQRGTLRVTGPIAFTLAVRRIQNEHPFKLVDPNQVGLKYSILSADAHTKLFGKKGNYRLQNRPIVQQHGLSKVKSSVYFIPDEQKKLRNGDPLPRPLIHPGQVSAAVLAWQFNSSLYSVADPVESQSSAYGEIPREFNATEALARYKVTA